MILCPAATRACGLLKSEARRATDLILTQGQFGAHVLGLLDSAYRGGQGQRGPREQANRPPPRYLPSDATGLVESFSPRILSNTTW